VVVTDPDRPTLPPGLDAVSQLDPHDWTQPHLGNLFAIRRLLLELLDDDEAAMQAHVSGGVPWEEAAGRTAGRIKALATAFLGGDPAFITLPGWNAPGGIDLHLRRHFDLKDGPPERAVADVLAKVVVTGRHLMGMPDADPEQVAATLQHSVELVARTLVGLPPEDPA
jgi:hypothetical protein